MSTRVGSLHNQMGPKNLGLMRHLKLMYYMRFLPVTWKNNQDHDNNEIFFENSTIKSVLLLSFDFIVAMNVFVYFYVWHLVNMGKDFDIRCIWTATYIVGVYNGHVTTALSQLFFILFPVFLFWLNTYLGE